MSLSRSFVYASVVFSRHSTPVPMPVSKRQLVFSIDASLRCFPSTCFAGYGMRKWG